MKTQLCPMASASPVCATHQLHFDASASIHLTRIIFGNQMPIEQCQKLSLSPAVTYWPLPFCIQLCTVSAPTDKMFELQLHQTYRECDWAATSISVPLTHAKPTTIVVDHRKSLVQSGPTFSDLYKHL